MKRIVLLIVFTSAFLQGFCANDSTHTHPFFFNALSVSINKTNVSNEGAEDRFGYGLGVYHISNSSKKINFVFGFEYNRTNQFVKYVTEGHFENATDMTYAINSTSIQMSVMFNFENNKGAAIFIEPGLSFDIIGASGTGTINIYEPTQPYQSYQGSQDAGGGAYIGLSIGIGIKIPISRTILIIKPGYKIDLGSIEPADVLIYNNYFRMMLQLKRR